MGLETTKRGIQVNQKGLDVVANNISNVKTEGYTRQRLDTVSVSIRSGYGRSYSSIPLAGQGVAAVGVGQIRNSFLDSKFREEYGDVGYYDQRQAMLSEIEAAISDPEVEGTGIKDALSTLLTAMTQFSENPYQEVQANNVRSAFTSVVQVLNQYSSKLDRIQKQQMEYLSISVDEVNSKLEQIADLNEAIVTQIRTCVDYDGKNYGPNELLDQRNLILDELARYGAVEVIQQEDGGVQVRFNGRMVVDGSGNQYTADRLILGADGLPMTWRGSGDEVKLPTGALKGYADVLTGGGQLDKGIPYYQNKLDHLAQQLVDAFNQVIPNDDGAAGYKTLLQGEDGVVTAANIKISDLWDANVNYIIQKNPDGEMDNTHVLNMKNLLEEDFSFDGEFTGTFSEFVTYITTSLGNDMTTNQARLETTISTAEGVDEERMSTSGVSLNEEGVEMMSYNKAYQALARMMTTMDEQLDVLINNTGLVGR